MYKFSRVYLPENHPYRRATFSFNGKPERMKRPDILSSMDWLMAYNIEKEKEIAYMFDSNGEPMFDDPNFFDTCWTEEGGGESIQEYLYLI